MTITVSSGWWLAPFMVTLASFGWAMFINRDNQPGGDYAALGGAMVTLFIYGIATIVSLIAWLIWAVLR